MSIGSIGVPYRVVVGWGRQRVAAGQQRLRPVLARAGQASWEWLGLQLADDGRRGRFTRHGTDGRGRRRDAGDLFVAVLSLSRIHPGSASGVSFRKRSARVVVAADISSGRLSRWPGTTGPRFSPQNAKSNPSDGGFKFGVSRRFD